MSTATGDSCELATARDPCLWLVDAGLDDDVCEVRTPEESRMDVTLENFCTVETAFQFDRSVAMCGGQVNRFAHLRAPVPLDRQSVIRMQRDTLYSVAIVDISELSLPDTGGGTSAPTS